MEVTKKEIKQNNIKQIKLTDPKGIYIYKKFIVILINNENEIYKTCFLSFEEVKQLFKDLNIKLSLDLGLNNYFISNWINNYKTLYL